MYETEAHTSSSSDDQPPFLNAVVRIDVECSPDELLRITQEIELGEGRRRKGRDRWAPRSLDIDLLTVGDVTCDTDELSLPHPRLADRRFVLRPWADLAPNHQVPPPFDASVQELLERCTDRLTVRRTSHTLSPAIRNSTEEASDHGE